MNTLPVVFRNASHQVLYKGKKQADIQRLLHLFERCVGLCIAVGSILCVKVGAVITKKYFHNYEMKLLKATYVKSATPPFPEFFMTWVNAKLERTTETP